MNKKRVIFIIFFVFMVVNQGFAQTSASQAQRAQELLEKERVLSEKVLEPEKAYIKKIIIQGANLLDKDKVKEIIAPFLNHWLTYSDIQQILGLIEQAYQEKGYPGQPKNISYEVKKKKLFIRVEEKQP